MLRKGMVLSFRFAGVLCFFGMVSVVGAESMAGDIRLTFHANGQVATEAEFEDGQRNGAYREFDSEGRLVAEGSYTMGRKDGTFKEFAASGRLLWLRSYRGGELHGNVRKWHPNGQIASEWKFDQGRPVGDAKEYDENGQIRKSWNYSKADCNGQVDKALFSADGQLVDVKQYRDNSLIVDLNRRRSIACAVDIAPAS